jgi:hypothetical protein
MFQHIIPILLLVDGLACTVFAIFAHEISLDPTPDWGSFRFTLVALGGFLIAISIWRFFSSRRVDRSSSLIESESVRTWFTLIHLWGIIILIYAWFVTFGNFTTWDHTTRYYAQLADAFGRGHTYVDLKPGRALLEAVDPYHPTDRPAFNDEIWDMSLYREKLYLYWGPVPALLITPIQLIFGKRITDNYPTFFFFAGLLIVNSLILLRLRRSYFPHLPAWTLFLSIALIGLIIPIPWSLATPDVYEAAIGAGQFFLLAGLYAIFSCIQPDGSIHQRGLFFAGIFWACSVGSRAINAFSVIFLAAFVSLWITRMIGRPFRKVDFIRSVSALCLPLLAGALLIGWYNWVRFDSPFEFGLRYQITIFNLNKDMDLVFRPEYMLYNLYIYLFQPFQIIQQFPFIQPIIISDMFRERGVVTPYLYAAGRVTGLLFSAPFLVFSLTHLFRGDARARVRQLINNPQPYNLVVLLLAGSFLINFIYILLCFFGQMRYLVDAISQITLLAVLGYWQMFPTQSDHTPRKWRIILANSLILVSITASLLLSMTGEANRMQKLNPELFERVNNALSISE